VPKFEVTHSAGWYEATCPELGLVITARDLPAIEATARRAARAASAADPVVIQLARSHQGLLATIARLFIHSDREGQS
jgi:hypothetical protein